MATAKIGLIGLAVMGQNLVRNFANKGIPIAVFNRTAAKTDAFVSEFKQLPIIGTKTIEEFVKSIEKPRKIILLVQAGDAVDAMIESLLPHVDKNDIIIDGGNSYFKDTIRRSAELTAKGLRFMGMGVSGGEKGALEGPSLMPGGDAKTYAELEPLLTKIAAQQPAPCVAFMGNGGAGHFVKMVHNGIEYADMQLIAEIYDIAKQVFSYSDEDLANLFDYFQTTDLNSYLIEITAKILRVKDDQKNDGAKSGALLVEKIKDEAKGKGTGTWTVQESASMGSPVPAIAAALDARNLSSSLRLRATFAKLFSSDLDASAAKAQASLAGISLAAGEQSQKLLAGVLLAGKILAYAQGFSMLFAADEAYSFNLNLSSVAKIWRNGCIIRSAMLDEMSRALESKTISTLVEDPYFQKRISENLRGMRTAIGLATAAGVSASALGTSLGYLDALRAKRLPAALIQAQRDFFGAHTYRRTDRDGDFHTQWEA